MNHDVTDSIVPPRLRPGDTVAVCAPAGPVPAAKLDRGLEILRARYEVVANREAMLEGHGFLAGTDERRAEELNGYLRDPDVRAVFVARGGYGLMRILPDLDVDAFRADPKPLVGFSDTTALHSWALACAGIRGIHGPVVTQLGDVPAHLHHHLFGLLENAQPPAPMRGAELAGAAVPIEGRLRGGNLCLLSMLVGTPYAQTFDNAIVFVEDVGERPYAIDRYMTHLALAGAFDTAAGAIVGDMHRCIEPKGDPVPAAVDVVCERFASVGVATATGFPFGHDSVNTALPMDARCVLHPDGTLEFLDAAVA